MAQSSIDTEAYEEMITELGNYLTAITESTEKMAAAGEDCADNMEGDPNAAKAKEKIDKCIEKINADLETVSSIIKDLQEELDEAIRAGQIMGDD